MVSERPSGLHDHLHDNLELAALLEKDRHTEVTKNESEGEQRSSGSILIFSAITVELDVSQNGNNLADDLKNVKLLLSDDRGTIGAEHNHRHFDEVDSCERDR